MIELPAALHALSQYNQFILYKTVPSKTRPGKTDKFPCDVTGNVIDAHDVKYHLSFEVASSAAQLLGLDVGFVFTKSDPFYFCDIDSCLNDSAWSDVANDLMTRLTGAAIEVSHSQSGLHIIGQYIGDEPEHGCKNIPLGLELYTSERFIALTGINAVGDSNYENTNQLLDVINYYFPLSNTPNHDLSAWTTTHVRNSTPIDNDDELIKKALRSTSAAAAFGNSASFKDLWQCNADELNSAFPDPTEAGRSFDASSADAALASHLSFWTGGNCERISVLMRQSALVRDKWDKHKSYMQRTITGAVGRSTSFYCVDPPSDPIPVNVQPGYISTYEFALDNNRSQTENAQNFLNYYYGGGKFLIIKNNIIFRFNGQYWASVEKSIIAAQFYQTAQFITGMTQSKLASNVALMFHSCVTAGEKVTAAPDSHINCNNGVFNMRTGELHAHSPDYLYLSVNAFDYDPNAQCPIMNDLISKYSCGDPLWVRQLDQMMGYILAGGKNNEEKVMVLDGVTRSGKSLIAQAVVSILGNKDVLSSDMAKLGDPKITNALFDCKLFYDDDAQTPDRQDEKAVSGFFKKIVSGSEVDNTQLYTQELRSGHVNPKMLFCSNGVPVIRDHSGATLARMMILDFQISYAGREDITLKNKIHADELPGILNRFHRGYLDYKVGGFTQCDTSISAHSEEAEATQPLMEYFNDENICTIDGVGVIKAASLTYHIQNWLSSKGHSMGRLSKGQLKKIIKQTLAAHGVIYKQSMRFDDCVTTGFTGITLKTAFGADRAVNNVTPIK